MSFRIKNLATLTAHIPIVLFMACASLFQSTLTDPVCLRAILISPSLCLRLLFFHSSGGILICVTETARVLCTKYQEEEIMEAYVCVGMMSRTYRSSVRSCTDKFCQKLHRQDPLWQSNNFEMDLKYRKGENVDWIHLAEDRDQWRMCLNMEISFQGLR